MQLLGGDLDKLGYQASFTGKATENIFAFNIYPNFTHTLTHTQSNKENHSSGRWSPCV